MMDNTINELLADFVLDSSERLKRIEELLLDLPDLKREQWEEHLTTIKREWHTLKGNSGMMGFGDLQSLAHNAEDSLQEILSDSSFIQKVLKLVDDFREKIDELNNSLIISDELKTKDDEKEELKIKEKTEASNPAMSVRVPFSSLDELVDLLAEMVIFRNRLIDAIKRGKSQKDSLAGWEEVEAAQESLGKTLTLIQDKIMQLRMVPIKSLFSSLRRIVYEESQREGKITRFEATGGDTALDKALLEVVSEALGHIIRNAVIHGIELPEERERKRKPKEGTIRLESYIRGNEVKIEVKDDGKGIDIEKVILSAKQRGIKLDKDSDPSYLIFLPNFSTKEDADLSAGRGVGLSVAYESIRKTGGRIEVESQKDKGCCFRITLPITVSIIRAMLLKVDGEEYAIPLNAIIESLKFVPDNNHKINHAGSYLWRDKVIPLLDLGIVFGNTQIIREKGYLIILEEDGKYRGLLCDEISEIKEIVIKNIDNIAKYHEGIAGATIMGDGRIILILDPKALMKIKPFIPEQQFINLNEENKMGVQNG